MTKQNKLKKPRKTKVEVPEMSAGGVLGDTASFAGMGASMGSVIPGLGTAIGAIGGATVGLVKGLFDHFKEKKAERIQQASIDINSSGALQANAGSSMNNFRDPWTAANGGVVPGGNPVELKGTETSLDPDNNSLARFDLPKRHPNQSRVPLKEGAVVFPDTMEIPEASPLRKYGKYFAEVSKSIDNERSKAQKTLDSKDSTLIARRTAERNIYNADRKYGELTGLLLSEHQRLGIDTNKQGIPKAAAGWIQGALKASGKFLNSDKGGQLMGTLGSLAPVMYNIGQGSRKPEQLDPTAFQNPMAYDALQSMSNRQVDTAPMLASNAESAAIAEANLRSSGAGAGAYRSGVTGIQNARMKANANALSQADAQNNVYRGQLGQMQGQLGQRMADTNLIVSDLNARNQAASRNYNAAAMGQLGQFSQVQQQMNNQRQRDQMLMPMYQSWMEMMSGNQTQTMQTQHNNINPNVGFNMSGPKAKYNMLNPKY